MNAGAGMEGKLTIDLYLQSNRVTRAGISSDRPLRACNIFIGKSKDEVLNILPLLFNICHFAQSFAAAGAMEQAMSMDVDPARKNIRLLLVQMETIREHLWRILLDWPRFMDETNPAGGMRTINELAKRFRLGLCPQGDPFVAEQTLADPDRELLEQVVDELFALLEDGVFAGPVSTWCRLKNEADLQAWAEQGNSVATRMIHNIYARGWADIGHTGIAALPALSDEELDDRLSANDAAEFIARPCWQGTTRETTSLIRRQQHAMMQMLAHHGNGLLNRMIARLLELALTARAIKAAVTGLRTAIGRNSEKCQAGKETGIGIARVEAARGCLVHRVELLEGRVKQYQILAPTEWNFHPQGALARGLTGLAYTDRNQLEYLAGLMINSVDPCVGYELRVH